MAKADQCSDIMMVPQERVMAMQMSQAAREMPNIDNMSVVNSKVHVGPKFVSVTQNVQNNEMVKDLPLPKYIWHVIKSTSKVERLACLAAVVAMATFILLVVYYTVYAKNADPELLDTAPHEWNITREMWLSREHIWFGTQDPFIPLKIVVIGHTAGNECHTFKACAAEIRSLQTYLFNSLGWDIQYNFLVGNDGRIYEGLGWNIEGAHTKSYNNCTLGVAFMGDYQADEQGPVPIRHTKVTQKQLNNTLRLFQEGVRLGYLDPDFKVLGARDLTNLPQSPGQTLYDVIRKWDNYDHDHTIPGRTCNDYYGINVTKV